MKKNINMQKVFLVGHQSQYQAVSQVKWKASASTLKLCLSQPVILPLWFKQTGVIGRTTGLVVFK